MRGIGEHIQLNLFFFRGPSLGEHYTINSVDACYDKGNKVYLLLSKMVSECRGSLTLRSTEIGHFLHDSRCVPRDHTGVFIQSFRLCFSPIRIFWGDVP